MVKPDGELNSIVIQQLNAKRGKVNTEGGNYCLGWHVGEISLTKSGKLSEARPPNERSRREGPKVGPYGEKPGEGQL